jgi:phytoene dehydrogenase-like protein
MSAMPDVVVIGGGANGLVAAAKLGRAGRRVLLLEKGDALGGQGRTVEFAPGFRAAPLGLDSGWLPDPVARDLGLEVLERSSADAGLSVAVGRGEFLRLSRDPARAADAIAHHSRDDAARWPAFTARMRKLAGFLEALYLSPSPDISTSSPGELLPLLDVARRFRALGRRDMVEFLRALPISVAELAADEFESAPLQAAIATGGIQDHRQGPRSGGTGFVLLHHLVGAPAGALRGRAPWRGGPDAFTQAAERAARSARVEIRTGAAVARLEVEDEAVSAVVLEGGEEIPARTVLSTANPAHTLLDWIDPVWLDPEFTHAVRNIRHRGCTAFVLYALDALPELPGLPPDALEGVVSLTPSVRALEQAADAAKYGEVSERPHIEITVPTLFWPDLAPEGRHVLVARVQYAPFRLRDGVAWDAVRRDALAGRVTSAIDLVAPGFRSRVLQRVVWSPLDLEERFGLREGAPSHGELGLDQILFMRPVAGWGRHGTPIGGLYLGGAGSHPGPGILGGPGWLAAKRILSDRRRRNGKP